MTTTATTTYERVTLADAQPGDEVWQAGTWVPVAAFHLFGSSVKIVWANGSTHSMPVSHCPTIRRAVATAAGDTTATEVLGAHTHYLAGADTLCSELTHCPSLCACPVDACDAARAGARCPNCAGVTVAPTPGTAEQGDYCASCGTAYGEHTAPTTLRGHWAVPVFNGRGVRTPHWLEQPGRVAVCGRDMGTGILGSHRTYPGDRRCQRCAAWVARQGGAA